MAACLMNIKVLQSYFSENQEVIIQVLYYVMIQLPHTHILLSRNKTFYVFFFGKSSFSVIKIYPPKVNFLQCTKFNFLSERVTSITFTRESYKGMRQQLNASLNFVSWIFTFA